MFYVIHISTLYVLDLHLDWPDVPRMGETGSNEDCICKSQMHPVIMYSNNIKMTIGLVACAGVKEIVKINLYAEINFWDQVNL